MTSERRQIKDRRSRPTPPISRHSIFGRRKGNRRISDKESYYVDWYESRYLILIVSILILCILDVYMTIKILQIGGKELNPVMLLLMQKQPALSLVLKYLITAACLIFLLIHKNFKVFGRIKAHSLIYGVFSLYFLLMLYEIYFFLTHFMI